MENSDTLALTESEVARRLNISISGLRKWRNTGCGPRFIRMGRLIRYVSQDIQTYLDGHSVDPRNPIHMHSGVIDSHAQHSGTETGK